MRAKSGVFSVYSIPRVRWHLWVRSYMRAVSGERSISRLASRLYTLVGR